MPSPYQNLTFDFYSEEHRRRIRSIYYAMIAEFDAMVGKYMDTVKAAGARVFYMPALVPGVLLYFGRDFLG